MIDMNRSERRKHKIVEKDPVLCIKRSVFEEKLQESYKKGYEAGQINDSVNAVLTMLLGLPIKVLKDHYGWGMKKRLPEFADLVINEYNRFDESAESIEQMQAMIYEESGIKFAQKPSK